MKIVGLKGVKIKKVHPNAEIPEYMTAGAACFDITAVNIDLRNSIGHSTQYATVRTGLAFEIPEGYKLCIVPRSSFCHKDWIMQNSPAQIDSDYRGEVKVLLINLSNEIYKIQPNERIGQLILSKVYKLDFEVKDGLSETKRGDGGFGHTGK